MAGIQNPIAEIDLAEVHDCFTWTEITNYEDLGFCPKGEGMHFIAEGRSSLSGDLPVNPSGGLKSFGHPIGASGVRMIYEVVTQLRGQAGRAPGARCGVRFGAQSRRPRIGGLCDRARETITMDVLYALRRAVQLHPDSIAAYDGDRTYTFAEFADRVTRVATALRGLGVEPGDRVSVLMLNSLRYLELYYAIPMAQALIVPINIRWNPAEIGFALSDSGSRLLVLDDCFARIAPALSAALPKLQYMFAGNAPCPAGMAITKLLSQRRRPVPSTARSRMRTIRSHCSTPAAPRAVRRASC